ncbi:MAG: hypothetical protein ACLGJC_05730 [Alphaproteobacteria bacterium]
MMDDPTLQPLPSFFFEQTYPQPPESHLPKLEAIDDLWRRGVKVPVETLCDLARLDGAEIADGYLDGLKPDAFEPGTNRSRAYWHGWRNGRMDRDPASKDAAAAELARRSYWWNMRSPPSGRVASEPHRYADLERALERGEPV